MLSGDSRIGFGAECLKTWSKITREWVRSRIDFQTTWASTTTTAWRQIANPPTPPPSPPPSPSQNSSRPETPFWPIRTRFRPCRMRPRRRQRQVWMRQTWTCKVRARLDCPRPDCLRPECPPFTGHHIQPIMRRYFTKKKLAIFSSESVLLIN